MNRMHRYSILPATHGKGFCIEVITGRGSHHTMLGFDTEIEAAQWVETDKRRELLGPSVLPHDFAS
jgi:hypothetical protein